MEGILQAAAMLAVSRGPRNHTKLQVLSWLVKRFQSNPKSKSR